MMTNVNKFSFIFYVNCFYCVTTMLSLMDTNIVASMIRHKEGSRAFAHYRVTDEVAEAKEIDEDMKRGLVSMSE